METKRCSKCGEEKPLSEFGLCSTSKDGHSYHCKICLRQYYKRYRTEHYVEITVRKKLWDSENRHKMSEYFHNRHISRRDIKKEYDAMYNSLHRDKRQKRYYTYPNPVVIGMLKSQGFTSITPDLIELKRAELKLKRAIKEKTNERN